jgi:hypothetical protein
LAKRFARILGWPFLGDVLEKCPNRFGEMEQNRLQQTDGRESWEVVLGNSWVAFFGDVLENPISELYRYISSIVYFKYCIFQVLHIIKVFILYIKADAT